jgi:SAM-dependent methyltransferase
MDAQALALATDIFHIVLFNGVLHHMDNNLAQHSLIEAGRVLRKDGYILVAEPVFTPGNVLSSFLLKHDRGNFIRTANEYKSLFGYLSIRREGYFPFSLHRFYFAVLENKIH